MKSRGDYVVTIYRDIALEGFNFTSAVMMQFATSLDISYNAEHLSEDSSLENTAHSLNNHVIRTVSGIEARARRPRANNVVK